MTEIVGVAITLFLIIDPLGNVPIFLAILKNVSPERRRWIIARELIIALAIMVAFLYLGPALLKALALSTEAVGIAGGLVLLIIAIRMIFPGRGGVMGNDKIDGEPLVVPLAVPLIAGPSILATLVLLASQGSTTEWLIALVAAWAVSAIILLGAGSLYRWVGDRGLRALERLMGMILVSISVQMLLNGLAGFFHLT